LKARTSLVDDAVREAWEHHLARVYDKGLALVAVGGYGRRELFPHSDIDLLLLVERAPDSPARKEAVSFFIRALWDCGLRLSHSVHTSSECCEVHDNNIELNISLLDERLIAGDTNLYGRLAASLPKFLQSRRPDMIKHLCQLARNRHAKFHGTIQHLEPNIKETPGGLRDLHLVWWLGKLKGSAEQAMAELGDAMHGAFCTHYGVTYISRQAAIRTSSASTRRTMRQS
jgi:[protein-PII] uridylyltransferase